MDFGGLYQRYAGDVFRFALYLSGNYGQAQDIAAETFARAWVAHDQIRIDTVKAYLLMIARNLYRDQVKASARREAAIEVMAEPACPGADPERVARDRERLRQTLAALRQLTERDRAALTMAVVEDLSYEQIAAALEMTEGAVKVRIHRARIALNRALDRKE